MLVASDANGEAEEGVGIVNVLVSTAVLRGVLVGSVEPTEPTVSEFVLCKLKSAYILILVRTCGRALCTTHFNLPSEEKQCNVTLGTNKVPTDHSCALGLSGAHV